MKKLNWKLKYFILTTLFIIIWGFSWNKKISASLDLLFWTFSTVAQVFVALGALLGMVAVFKLQIINNEIERMIPSLENLIFPFRGFHGKYLSQEEILNEGEEIIKENLPSSKTDVVRLKIAIPKYKFLLKEKRDIKNEVLKFTRNILLLVFLSILFLILTPIIVEFYFSIVFLIIILYFSILSLISVLKLLKKIL